MNHFGEHIMIDIYSVADSILDDKKLIEKAFKEIIEKANMNPLSKFNIYEVIEDKNSKRDFGGVTAFQVINESHMSIHTFRGIGFVSMDLYTCTSIPVELIVAEVKNFLKSDDIEYRFVERGLKFNEHLEKYLENRK